MSSDSNDAAAFCAELVRSHDFVRYASTLFVPSEQRRALLALYAFNAEIVRVQGSVTQPLAGEMRLQWWSDMLAGSGHGGVEGNPVAAELLLAIRNFDLPIGPLSRLIAEHQFDLYNDPMPTLAALEGYATETSAALFALATLIAVPPSAAIDHLARHAGLAQCFVHVAASLPRDAARRQLFIPLQLLERHGLDMEELFQGRSTAALRAALNELLAEARQHLDAAYRLLADAPPQGRAAFLPLAMVRRDLARLSRADNDPFQPYIASRLGTLWRIWRASRSKPF